MLRCVWLCWLHIVWFKTNTRELGQGTGGSKLGTGNWGHKQPQRPSRQIRGSHEMPGPQASGRQLDGRSPRPTPLVPRKGLIRSTRRELRHEFSGVGEERCGNPCREGGEGVRQMGPFLFGSWIGRCGRWKVGLEMLCFHLDPQRCGAERSFRSRATSTWDLANVGAFVLGRNQNLLNTQC